MPRCFPQAPSAREKYRPVLSCGTMTQHAVKGYTWFSKDMAAVGGFPGDMDSGNV